MHIRIIIKHRINKIEDLAKTSTELGIELDIRARGDRIILHHDAFADGEDFELFLENYKHRFLILNTKCEGMELRLIELMNKYNISDYFFLDLSIPFLIKTSNTGCKKIAIRFSEYEPLPFVENFIGMADWVWVDCFTKNILNRQAYETLSKHFKICIVSPELQFHPLSQIQGLKEAYKDFHLDAVCTKHPELWK